jgi:hypothetical protein
LMCDAIVAVRLAMPASVGRVHARSGPRSSSNSLSLGYSYINSLTRPNMPTDWQYQTVSQPSAGNVRSAGPVASSSVARLPSTASSGAVATRAIRRLGGTQPRRQPDLELGRDAEVHQQGRAVPRSPSGPGDTVQHEV